MGFLSNFLNTARAAPDDDVSQIRSRARRRLIGAAVLLLAGVIGFPLLFETQPRTVPADIPTVIARKDASAEAGSPTKIADKSVPANESASTPAGAGKPGALKSEAGVPPMIIESAAGAANVPPGVSATTATAAVAAAAAAAAVAVTSPSTKPKPAPAQATSTVKPIDTTKPATATVRPTPPVPKPVVSTTKPSAPAAKPASPAKPPTTAPALAKPIESVAKAAAPSGVRFAVQFGAFAQASGVKDVRSKLERVGLKSYTQNIKVAGSKRTRVRAGPYNTREEAERAATKARAVGLTASVVPLE